MTARTKVGIASALSLMVLIALAGFNTYRGLTSTVRIGHRDESKGGAAFCLVLDPPQKQAQLIRLAIRGTPKYPTHDLVGMRSTLTFFYGPEVGTDVPMKDRPDAELVLAAFREAIKVGAESPLDRPEVRTAMTRLARSSNKLCEGVL